MPPSPETVARARQQYIDGVPVKQIRAENQMPGGTLYYWLAGGPSGKDRLPAIPLRMRKVEDAVCVRGRKALIARLWRSASRQVREIEERLQRAAAVEPGARERDARLLAVMVKTLRELTALDEARLAAAKACAATQIDAENDDPVPRDIDEFRFELARRIDAFIASKAAAGVSGDTEE